MAKEKNVMIKPYRPEGWDDKTIPSLVEDCMKAGEIEYSGEEEKKRIELFVAHCINVGFNAMLNAVRPHGVDAVVQQTKVMTATYSGKIIYQDTGMTYKTGYSGLGRVVFIPADKELFRR